NVADFHSSSSISLRLHQSNIVLLCRQQELPTLDLPGGGSLYVPHALQTYSWTDFRPWVGSPACVRIPYELVR
ncbi:hypothetical protein L914_10116, partial [Phytophthora nicotianae]